jgi:hypothetical protein
MNNIKPTEKMFDKFFCKYAPEGDKQRKEFIIQFRKMANIYAGVQGKRIAELERSNAELKRCLNDSASYINEMFLTKN